MFLNICLLTLALGSTFVVAEVDESSLDLSQFKLRKVDTNIYDQNQNDDPDAIVVPAEETASDREFTEEHMEVLRSVGEKIAKFGRHGIGLSKWPAVPISSVMNFDSYWKLLQNAKLDKNTKLGAEALAFRSEPANIEIAQRVEKSVLAYVRIAKILNHIQDLEISGTAKDMDVSYWVLENHLNELDPMVDISAIRKAVTAYKNKDRKQKKLSLRFWKHL